VKKNQNFIFLGVISPNLGKFYFYQKNLKLGKYISPKEKSSPKKISKIATIFAPPKKKPMHNLAN
jgi:hypothetical protein